MAHAPTQMDLSWSVSLFASLDLEIGNVAKIEPEDITWVDPDKAHQGAHTVSVYVDYWWVVNVEGQIALYKGRYPQCNTHPTIAERAMRTVPDAVRIDQIPMVMIPHRCER